MKKILTIAAMVGIYTAAFSQGGEDTKVFSIGPSVGYGHAAVRNTDGSDLFNPSWNAGVILNYSTSEHLGFAADVLWSMEGALVENEGTGMDTDLRLNYIRVPLKFVYFFGDFANDFRPKITIGPSMGFLLNAEIEPENGSAADVTSSYQVFDLGGNASIGFNWKLGDNVWLNTDLNYYTGFTPIHFADQYNTNLGLKVGVAFGL